MNIWQHIQIEIQKTTDRPFTIKSRASVAGGDINQAVKIVGDRVSYFVKLNHDSNRAMFVQESVGLSALRETNSFVVPQVITAGTFNDTDYLILEYIEMKKHGDMKLFAKALASLHLSTVSHFGFSSNNYIGRTSQINTLEKNWGRFFTEHRIAVQLGLLTKKDVSNSLTIKGKELIKKLPSYFSNHKPKPSLVHGDLWQGNYAFDQGGNPTIFDPACYYADHEVDLAMLELFGNPGHEFFETYNQYYKIGEGYSERKKIYNLYHVLNHANMFGGGYVPQTEQMIESILFELG